MPERTYLDFDLLIEPGAGDSYRARVLASPVGETRAVPVTIPLSELEFENFLLRIGRPRHYATRGGGEPELRAVREFGTKLFHAVFHDEVRDALTGSLDRAETMDAGLRLRLRLADCPELGVYPWEMLYDSDVRRFLALSEWTPVVRYLDLPGRIRPLAVEPPLRILVMVASPTDFPPLDAAAEWVRLQESLGELQRSGRVELDLAPGGTLAALQRQLRHGSYHVFHYIGHGGYDSAAEDGVLALEGANGRAQPVSGTDLGAQLHDHRTLRLAVLNACEGARGGRTDPYSGTAQSLIYQGIPAVVAMQFEITDRAALTFTRGLYEAVADGYPLDAAVAEARKAIHNEPNPVEWGTPVLYLRAPDGRIFDLAAATRPIPPAAPQKPVRQAATSRAALAGEHAEAAPRPTLDQTLVLPMAVPPPARPPGPPPTRPTLQRPGPGRRPGRSHVSRSSRRWWLIGVILVLLAGGTAAAVVLLSGGSGPTEKKAPSTSPSPSASPPPTPSPAPAPPPVPSQPTTSAPRATSGTTTSAPEVPAPPPPDSVPQLPSTVFIPTYTAIVPTTGAG